MEQQLKERLKNGTYDEVDEAMAMARLKLAGKTLDAAVSKAADEIHEIFQQYHDELMMLGSTVILYYKDRLYDINEPGEFQVELIDGHGKFVEQAKQKLNAVETRK